MLISLPENWTLRAVGHWLFGALGCAKFLKDFLRQFYVKSFKGRNIGIAVSKRPEGVFHGLPFLPLTFQNRSAFFHPLAGM